MSTRLAANKYKRTLCGNTFHSDTMPVPCSPQPVSPEGQEPADDTVRPSGPVPRYRRDLPRNVLCSARRVKASCPVLSKDSSDHSQRVPHCKTKYIQLATKDHTPGQPATVVQEVPAVGDTYS